MAIRYNEDTGQYFKTSEDEPPVEVVRSPDGESWIAVGSPQYYQQTYVAPSYANFESAAARYSSGKVPWDYTSLLGQTGYGTKESQGGLSSREAFNLNALWGATQYAQGRVTDFSHIDSTQLQANQIAGSTRDELWNTYNQLAAQGKAPARNPDQAALDFYVQNVGAQGNTYGYGPGANTVLVTEAIKNKFLNQPEVIQATGSRYTTPEAQLRAATEFGAAHEAGVPVWQVFEQQGYSKDLLSSLMPMILGAMIFPGLGGALANALGGGIAGNIAAASIIGGVNAEIQGGNFIDGAIKSALTAGAGSAASSIGIAADVSDALKSIDIAPNVANFVAKTVENAATAAVVAEATGGDAASAVENSLLSAGVSVVRSEVTDIVKNITAKETAADIEDADVGRAMKDADAAAQQRAEDIQPLPASYDQMFAQAGGTMLDAPVVDVSGEEGAPLDVIGAPFYEGMAGADQLTNIPEGMRLATYDEALSGGPATILPNGQMAFLVPIEEPTRIEAPIEDGGIAPGAVPVIGGESQAQEFEPTYQELLNVIQQEQDIDVPRGTMQAPAEMAAEPTQTPVTEVATEPTPIAEPAPEPVVEPTPETPTEIPAGEVTPEEVLQALVDKGIIPAEEAAPLEPDVSIEEPLPPAEEEIIEEPLTEPVPEPGVEEPMPDMTEELPEEVTIPEAMPEVEPEPVLPEEGQIEQEEAQPEEAATTGEAGIEDQEVLDALAEEDTGEEVTPEEEAVDEMAPEEEALPAEEPAEEAAPEEEVGPEEEPIEGPSNIDKLIASLLLSERGGGARPAARSVTQESVSPREISGSVTGIIGKKQPMFGSDEDEQSAEWNRRSLRLRKVLGL